MGKPKSAGPWALEACGTALSTILPSSLTILFYHAPLSTLSTLHSPVLEFHSPSFLFPLALEGWCRREGWGSESWISDGGGWPRLPLATQAPWPAALLALLAVQDRPRSSQEPPGANQEPPRATQDRLKIPKERPKIAQERPKSPQERPKTTPRGPKSDPRALSREAPPQS